MKFAEVKSNTKDAERERSSKVCCCKESRLKMEAESLTHDNELRLELSTIHKMERKKTKRELERVTLVEDIYQTHTEHKIRGRTSRMSLNCKYMGKHGLDCIWLLEDTRAWRTGFLQCIVFCLVLRSQEETWKDI